MSDIEKDAMAQIKFCSRLVWETVRAFEVSVGLPERAPWTLATSELQADVLNDVMARISEPLNTPYNNHDIWCKRYRDMGFVWGPTIDNAKKTHPMLMPYKDLPQTVRSRDFIFHAIIHALTQPSNVSMAWSLDFSGFSDQDPATLGTEQ